MASDITAETLRATDDWGTFYSADNGENVACPHFPFYFWRTHAGQEVDIVMEEGATVQAVECKLSGSASAPTLWRETYPDARFSVINRDNYLDALL